MHIFIDESGTFTRSPKKLHSISCVGALVVPDSKLVKISQKFDKLRKSLTTKNGEVKGSNLQEREIATVINFLVKSSLIFEVTVVDMAVHSDDEITTHKLSQA